MSSGDEDIVLRFTRQLPTQVHYDVPVVRYLVKQACHCLPLLLEGEKSRAGTTPAGLPIYALTLDNLILSDTSNAEGVSPGLLDLFFRLVEVLLARSLSDSVLHDPVAREKARRQSAVLVDARVNLLGIHALAQRLACPRLRTWSEREVTNILSDENALPMLQYALSDGANDAFEVRIGCENIYRQVLLWYYSMRVDAEKTREFKHEFAALLRRVSSNVVEDAFARHTGVDAHAKRITMRGCMVKCGRCLDASLHEHTVQDDHKFDYRPFHLHSLTYNEAGPTGYWGVYMVDYANGDHAIVMKHVPSSIVQKHAGSARNADDTLTLESKMALYHDANQTLADAPAIDDERFLCSANLGFLRRASRANNFQPASLIMKDVVFTGRNTALDLNGAPSSLAHIKLLIPSVVASTLDAADRYHGTCQFCHRWRPVTILTYCIQIEKQTVDSMIIDN